MAQFLFLFLCLIHAFIAEPMLRLQKHSIKPSKNRHVVIDMPNEDEPSDGFVIDISEEIKYLLDTSTIMSEPFVYMNIANGQESGIIVKRPVEIRLPLDKKQSVDGIIDGILSKENQERARQKIIDKTLNLGMGCILLQSPIETLIWDVVRECVEMASGKHLLKSAAGKLRCKKNELVIKIDKKAIVNLTPEYRELLKGLIMNIYSAVSEECIVSLLVNRPADPIGSVVNVLLLNSLGFLGYASGASNKVIKFINHRQYVKYLKDQKIEDLNFFKALMKKIVENISAPCSDN